MKKGDEKKTALEVPVQEQHKLKITKGKLIEVKIFKI